MKNTTGRRRRSRLTELLRAQAGAHAWSASGPAPDIAAQAAELWQRLRAPLPKPELRHVADWKLQGYTNEEIQAPRLRPPHGRAPAQGDPQRLD
jgi:hypothetical protein